MIHDFLREIRSNLSDAQNNSDPQSLGDMLDASWKEAGLFDEKGRPELFDLTRYINPLSAPIVVDCLFDMWKSKFMLENLDLLSPVVDQADSVKTLVDQTETIIRTFDDNAGLAHYDDRLAEIEQRIEALKAKINQPRA